MGHVNSKCHLVMNYPSDDSAIAVLIATLCTVHVNESNRNVVEIASFEKKLSHSLSVVVISQWSGIVDARKKHVIHVSCN